MERYEHLAEEMRELVREAIARRRHVLVHHIAKSFYSALESAPNTSGQVSGGQPEWMRIESLSSLRALVGGRFQNLKDRWVNAGFPLREHRGDRSGKKNVDSEGWVELSSWIYKQGFEIRLAEPHEPWLFEIRKLSEETRAVELKV